MVGGYNFTTMKLFKLLFYLTILLQIYRMILVPFDLDTIAITILCVAIIAEIYYIEKLEQ